MNSEQIKDIVGTQKKHDLKKYVLTLGGEIIESYKLEYDDFMECYGISIPCDEYKGYSKFEVVSIKSESDDYEELELERDMRNERLN